MARRKRHSVPRARAGYRGKARPHADDKPELIGAEPVVSERRAARRELATMVLSGPLLMVVLMLLGMASGYTLGFIPSCVVLPILAIALAVRLGRIAGGTQALLAFACAVMVGIFSASAYDNLRLFANGDAVTDLAIADLPRFASKELVNFRDGEMRRDLTESASTRISHGAQTRTHSTATCDAFPIVAAGWDPSMPIQIWRFGATDWGYHPLREQLFHPTTPDDLCRRAIDKVIARHHLKTAPDAVYLEEKLADSVDPRTNQVLPLVSAAFLGALWIVWALLVGLVRAIASRRRGS